MESEIRIIALICIVVIFLKKIDKFRHVYCSKNHGKIKKCRKSLKSYYLKQVCDKRGKIFFLTM